MWLLHIIFFRLRWSPSSWCNLVFLFISWPFYNTKSYISNRSASSFEKIASRSDICHDFRILYLPEPVRHYSRQSRKTTRWACRCLGPSKKIQYWEQWSSYLSGGFHFNSYFSFHQGPIDKIHESVYRDNAGTSRATKAPIKSQDPRGLLESISYGLLSLKLAI